MASEEEQEQDPEALKEQLHGLPDEAAPLPRSGEHEGAGPEDETKIMAKIPREKVDEIKRELRLKQEKEGEKSE